MNCLFCKINSGDINSYKIYEDELVIAFLDINPQSNGHTLIVPKNHYENYLDIDNDLFGHILKIAKLLHNQLEEKLNCDGITMLHNYGIAQEIKHYHFHLIPRYSKEEKLTIEQVYEKLKKESIS